MPTKDQIKQWIGQMRFIGTLQGRDVSEGQVELTDGQIVPVWVINHSIPTPSSDGRGTSYLKAWPVVTFTKPPLDETVTPSESEFRFSSPSHLTSSSWPDLKWDYFAETAREQRKRLWAHVQDKPTETESE